MARVKLYMHILSLSYFDKKVKSPLLFVFTLGVSF